MKEIEKLIERKKKEMEELVVKYNNTPIGHNSALERLDIRIEKLRHYIMGLEDALLYIKMEKGML